MENLIFLRPLIYSICFSNHGFFINNDRTEGKFVIYKNENKIKLYGLLWTDKIIEHDYHFNIKRIDYGELTRWIHRARCRHLSDKIKFDKTFYINEEMVGGGFLSKDLEKRLFITYRDEKIKSADGDVIKKCLGSLFNFKSMDKIRIT